MIVLIVIVSMLAIWGIWEVCFYLSHRRPLTEDEIYLLAGKRRKRRITEYYSFSRAEIQADKNFKSKMKPNGQLYQIDNSLSDMPALAAALLKGKKHEWVLIAFEANKKIVLLWCNKGSSNKSVSLSADFDQLTRIAKEKQCTTLLRFHNHPNPDPSHLDCTKPSQQDFVSANYLSDNAGKCSLNWFDFVCERGVHYQYYSNVIDSFFPIFDFINTLSKENNISQSQNYHLHLENRRSK